MHTNVMPRRLVATTQPDNHPRGVIRHSDLALTFAIYANHSPDGASATPAVDATLVAVVAAN